jgi:hypothetical protein
VTAVEIRLCRAHTSDGIWSEEAVAGLVGQTPRLVIDSDTNAHTSAPVRAARIEDGWVLVTLDVPSELVSDRLSVWPYWRTDH